MRSLSHARSLCVPRAASLEREKKRERKRKKNGVRRLLSFSLICFLLSAFSSSLHSSSLDRRKTSSFPSSASPGPRERARDLSLFELTLCLFLLLAPETEAKSSALSSDLHKEWKGARLELRSTLSRIDPLRPIQSALFSLLSQRLSQEVADTDRYPT